MKSLLLHLSRNLGNFATSTRHSKIPFLSLPGDKEGDRAIGSSIAGSCGEEMEEVLIKSWPCGAGLTL